MEGSVHQLNQHDFVVPEVMRVHREEGVFPSIYPSGILFSGVFLEYFAAIGDRLSEFACLFYVRIISLDACLIL